MSEMHETYNTLDGEERQQMDSSEEAARVINRRSKKFPFGKTLIVGTCCLALLALVIGVAVQISSRKRVQPYSQSSYAPKNAVSYANVEEIECASDRMQNEQPFERGEYICSPNDRYAVGLDESGDFVWVDRKAKVKAPYFDRSVFFTSSDPSYFMVDGDGSLLLYRQNGSTVWRGEPTLDVTPCRENLTDCPFLQLHNGGVLVLRWKDEDGNSMEHSLSKVFGDGSSSSISSDGGNSQKEASAAAVEDEKESTEAETPIATHDLGRVPTYSCVGERLETLVPLKVGEFICSANNDYVVGITDAGHFAWVNVTSGDEVPYYSLPSGKTSPASFVLNELGTMVLAKEDEKTVWEQEAQSDTPVEFHQKCLGDLNCPYLHLHNDGVLVLNWIDESSGSMNEHNVKKVYSF